MRATPADDGRVWTQVTDVLHINETACNIAVIRRPVGVDYVSTAFLAHMAYGRCGDAVMRLIAQASELHGDVLSKDK